MSSDHPQADSVVANGPEATTRRDKERQRKKNQAAAKKAAKKLAVQADHDTTKRNEEAHKADIAARVLSKMSTPANAAIAAFHASKKKKGVPFSDFPANVQQRIVEMVLPEGVMLSSAGYADKWEMLWSGHASLKWVAELLCVTKTFSKYTVRAIGKYYTLVIFYTLPISNAVEIEFQTPPGQLPVIQGGKVFPRYLREAATSLRICQLQNGFMLKKHDLTVSAFPKLKKLEVLAGDIGNAMKQLASLVDNKGYITTSKGSFNVRSKLERIQKVYEDNDKDFESQARFWNNIQHFVVPRAWDPVLFRFGFDMVLQSTFDSTTSDPSKILGDLCSEVLGIRREAVRGLRQGVDLEIRLCDDNEDGKEVI